MLELIKSCNMNRNTPFLQAVSDEHWNEEVKIWGNPKLNIWASMLARKGVDMGKRGAKKELLRKKSLPAECIGWEKLELDEIKLKDYGGKRLQKSMSPNVPQVVGLLSPSMVASHQCSENKVEEKLQVYPIKTLVVDMERSNIPTVIKTPRRKEAALHQLLFLQ